MSTERRRLSRGTGLALTLSLGIVALSGCTMADSLAPVAGDKLNSVRFASIDILTEKKIEIAVAPVCTQTDTEYSCKGEAMDNKPIEVTAPVADTIIMTVKVGGAELYKGNVTEVLDRAGRVG